MIAQSPLYILLGILLGIGIAGVIAGIAILLRLVVILWQTRNIKE